MTSSIASTRPVARAPKSAPTTRWAALALALATTLFARSASADPPADTAPPQRLGFTDVVRRAMERTPSVGLADAQLRRARAQWEQARAPWLPTLTANGTYTRLDADRTLSGRLLAGANQLNLNATLVVPIVSANRWAAYSRAGAAVDVASMSVEDARRQAAIAAARAYLAVSSQHRIVATLERSVTNAEEHRAFAQQRLDGGVGNRGDLVRAAQDAAVARGQLANASLALARLQSTLGVLIGEDGPVDGAEDAPVAIGGAIPTGRDTQGAIDSSNSARVDVRIARAQVTLADRAVREAWTDYLPSLLGSFQAYYQNPATPTLPEFGWQAQLVLSIPLFDGGLRYGVQHERQAAAQEARVNLDALLRQARADVRLAVESIRRAEDAAEAAREARRLADESVALAQQAFREGASTNIEVIDAQRRARDAAASAYAAEDDAREARLDLLIASGRFP